MATSTVSVKQKSLPMGTSSRSENFWLTPFSSTLYSGMKRSDSLRTKEPREKVASKIIVITSQK